MKLGLVKTGPSPQRAWALACDARVLAEALRRMESLSIRGPQEKFGAILRINILFRNQDPICLF